MNNAPKEIWLQWDPDGDGMYFYPSEGVTWCGEQINDTDVRYVRADAQGAAPEPLGYWEWSGLEHDENWKQLAHRLDDDCRYMRSENARLQALLDVQPAMPEPDWTNAPSQANWWAVSVDGSAAWFTEKPQLFQAGGTWLCELDNGRPVGHVFAAGHVDLPVGRNWRTTLRRRPEVQP